MLQIPEKKVKIEELPQTLSGISSCTACPHWGRTCIWNLPARSNEEIVTMKLILNAIIILLG